MTDLPTGPEREAFLAKHVAGFLDGVYYATYYRTGKSQLNLSEEATSHFTKLRVLMELEKDMT